MNRLLVATRSRGKQAEFRALLAPFAREIVFPDEVGLRESVAEAGLESFDTFEANARAKARWFATHAGLITLADDSGLEVDALGGAPGVLSKRFAGRDGPDEQVADENNRLLLARLADFPDSQRTARYRCVLVLASGPGETTEHSEVAVSGMAEGRIVRVARGQCGFGYDPLFFSTDLGRTFGEATMAEKDAVSHRARAVAALAPVLAHRSV